MGKHVRSIVIVVVIFLAVIMVVNQFVRSQQPAAKLNYSQFYAQVLDNACRAPGTT